MVFLLATIVLIDWVANKKLQGKNDKQTSISQIKGNGYQNPQSFLERDPWSFFTPHWAPQKDAWLFPNQDISKWLEDPENRIEKDFKPTATQKERAAFWLNVYGRYSSRFKIVHDRNHLNIIYGIIDFRALYRQLGQGPTTDSIAYRIESKILKQLKEKLHLAIQLKKQDSVSNLEVSQIRSFLSSVGAYSALETKELLEGVRSQTGQKDMFLQALFRSEQLLPHIEAEFRKNSLPIFLARIPFVESSFNAKALSSVGAMGIWQFMPETARQMISQEEQKSWSDPILQTRSAIKLLKIFKVYLPDWPLTITAYNSGVGRVKRLVEQHKAKNIDGLLAVNDSLGFAGQNFYAEVLAANIVEAYKEEIFGETLKFGDKNLSLVLKEKLPQEWCDL